MMAFGGTNPDNTTIHTVFPKRDRQYFGRNFGKFRKLLIIFGSNYPDNPCD